MNFQNKILLTFGHLALNIVRLIKINFWFWKHCVLYRNNYGFYFLFFGSLFFLNVCIYFFFVQWFSYICIFSILFSVFAFRRCLFAIRQVNFVHFLIFFIEYWLIWDWFSDNHSLVKFILFENSPISYTLMTGVVSTSAAHSNSRYKNF